MFLLESGEITRAGARQSSSFSGKLPTNTPGALAALASPSGDASIIVMSKGMTTAYVTGEIDSVTVDMPSTEGDGSISFSGRDKSAKLHEGKSSEKFLNQKNSDVVQQLAQRAGLSVQADSTAMKAGKIVQIDWAKLNDNISYAAVIHKLAELDGARWFMDANGTLHYSIQGPSGGAYTIMYDAGPPIVSDALKLEFKRNVQASKNQKVSVKSWNPQQKKVNEGTGTAGSSIEGEQQFNFHIPNLTKEKAQKYADSRAKESARHAVTVTATCVGDPSIAIDMKLVIFGTGAFDGEYDIDSIHDQVGIGGHTMTITAKTSGDDG